MSMLKASKDSSGRGLPGGIVKTGDKIPIITGEKIPTPYKINTKDLST